MARIKSLAYDETVNLIMEIKVLMVKNNLSQRALAKKLKISEAACSKLFHLPDNIKLLQRIHKMLGGNNG